ncbi:acyl-CoA thioesterase [Pseudonocardia pini]|uniref:acyl-CoA thioesterase n=1 Tax=Pseudonocardia pini TaxID=2758030 RepID=UPI0015F12085|nr:acyl-CoA thioesterase II [Pseudonocardia pini]
MSTTSVGRGGHGLAALMELERVGRDRFRSGTVVHPARPNRPLRVFGGQVAGQALVAAGRTVPDDRAVHSLHAHFLRAGEQAEPIDYAVEALRDGGSYSTRRVVAEQRGEAIFTLTASFARAEEGFRHQVPRSAGVDPEDLPPAMEVVAAAGEPNVSWFTALQSMWPLEMRFDGDLPRIASVRGERGEPRQRFWLRSLEPLGDDPLVHVGAVTYASDVFLLSVALPPHGYYVGGPGLAFASLDHAVWFHRPFRADEWFHYDQESTWAGNGRALCRGLVFDRAGELVASVMQEALIRRTGDG